jgi:hypothetical protein
MNKIISDFCFLDVVQDIISIVSARATSIAQCFGRSNNAGLSNARLLAALRALDEVDMRTSILCTCTEGSMPQQTQGRMHKHTDTCTHAHEQFMDTCSHIAHKLTYMDTQQETYSTFTYKHCCTRRLTHLHMNTHTLRKWDGLQALQAVSCCIRLSASPPRNACASFACHVGLYTAYCGLHSLPASESRHQMHQGSPALASQARESLHSWPLQGRPPPPHPPPCARARARTHSNCTIDNITYVLARDTHRLVPTPS